MTIIKGMLAVPLLFVALATTHCTKSGFGGGGGNVKGASLDATAGGKDSGADAADGEGLGNTDSAADASDVGMNDLGGRDTDVPGADSSDSFDDGGNGSGGGDGDGDNDDDDSPDSDDPESDKTKKKKKGGDDDKDADDDDETLAKTKYGATVTRILADDAFDMKIEVMVSGKVLNTATLSWEDDMNDDDGITKVAAGVCRAGKDTCLKITFTNTDDNGNHGGHVETAGVTPCVFVQESGTTATIDFDANGGEGGGFHQGTCRPGEDEQLTISCPNSKKLQVQACGK